MGGVSAFWRSADVTLLEVDEQAVVGDQLGRPGSGSLRVSSQPHNWQSSEQALGL